VKILQGDHERRTIDPRRIPVALLVIEFARKSPGKFNLHIIFEIGAD